MQKQRGFTLIELIIVIIILGILSVAAAPRFIDVRSDAITSTLKSVQGALQSGAKLVYAKSVIEGKYKNAEAGDVTSQVLINGINVDTDFGYPDAEKVSSTSLAAWLDLDESEWKLTIGSGGWGATPAGGTFSITYGTEDPVNFGVAGDKCYVLYTDAANENTPPVVSILTDGC